MLNPQDFRYKQIIQHAPTLLKEVNKNDDLVIDIINYKIIVDQSFEISDRYRLPLPVNTLNTAVLYQDINERGNRYDYIQHYFKKFDINADKIHFKGYLAYIWCDRTETIVIGNITESQ